MTLITRRALVPGMLQASCTLTATGTDDPTPPDGVTVPPIALDITLAACYLAQEALSLQTAQNASRSRPSSGLLRSVRVGEREEVYATPLPSSGTGLGLGGVLSQTAESLLSRYRKVPAPVLC
jgi:hypothetical protein